MIPPRRLFTWIDVDDQLAAVARSYGWPGWLNEASAYWDSLDLVLEKEVPLDEIRDWLGKCLGQGIVTESSGSLFVQLENAGTGPERTLEIELSIRPGFQLTREPLWRQSSAHPSIANAFEAPESPLEVPVFAFHSYKGGVGRTTHALAAAMSLAKRNRVLVVDADIEAPGLSWMFRNSGREADYSFEDFLALVQSTAAGDPKVAVDLAKRYVPNQAFGGIQFIPVRRDLLSLTPPRVSPADLLTQSRSAYHLTDALAALAVGLGASAVVIDLRAGASEFSSQLLLDPRVNRIFVTSASSQSVDGTEVILEHVTRLAPASKDVHPFPAVVLTQYLSSTPPEDLSVVVAPLVAAIARTREDPGQELSTTQDESDNIDLSEAIQPVFSVFRESLLQLPGAWTDVADVINEAHLPALLEQIVSLPALSQHEDPTQDRVSEIDADVLRARRKQLASFAKPLTYADSSSSQDFLVTAALQELVLSHRTVLPLAVVVGSKGSGKTFTQLQMISRGSWQHYADATQVDEVSADAPIVPVLTSKSLAHAAETAVLKFRDEAAGLEVNFSLLALREKIDEALRSALSDREWRQLWLWSLVRSVGIEVSPDQAEDAIINAAREGKQWLFVLDGLEDVLQNISTESNQQQALRVLLTDCLDWLRSVRNQPFGLVVFVRKDLVRASLPQNSAQFLSRYGNYELLWDENEAVRLAAWVATRSGSVGDPTADVQSLSSNDLTKYMIPVWGEKLGTARSREARSRTWFLAALSDFNTSIQARDIVLFMAEAAAASLDDTRWTDRLLVPVAMRNALLKCSIQKIDEITEESPAVGKAFTKLRNLDAEKQQVPFTRDDVNLSDLEIDLLEQNGVLFREGNQYWIPEIFRHGLRFRATGRPRILSVANLVRKRNNA